MSSAYTNFVRTWAKRNGVTYMCAIGKQGLKDEYAESKKIQNKKGRAIQAVSRTTFKPREKRTRKAKEVPPPPRKQSNLEKFREIKKKNAEKTKMAKEDKKGLR